MFRVSAATQVGQVVTSTRSSFASWNSQTLNPSQLFAPVSQDFSFIYFPVRSTPTILKAVHGTCRKSRRQLFVTRKNRQEIKLNASAGSQGVSLQQQDEATSTVVEEDALVSDSIHGVEALAASSRTPTSFISTVQDLTDMVKDAEKNILLLNRIRARALEELHQARTEIEGLQGQVKVLQARLAESDARLTLASHSRAKSQLLEKQMRELERKLERQGTGDTEVRELSQELVLAQTRLAEAETKVNKLAGVEEENEQLKQQFVMAMVELASFREMENELRVKEEKMMETQERLVEEREADRRAVQEEIEELKGKIQEVADNGAELTAKLESEVSATKEELEVTKKSLEAALLDLEKAAENVNSLQEEAKFLHEQLEQKEGEAERNVNEERLRAAAMEIELGRLRAEKLSLEEDWKRAQEAAAKIAVVVSQGGKESNAAAKAEEEVERLKRHNEELLQELRQAEEEAQGLSEAELKLGRLEQEMEMVRGLAAKAGTLEKATVEVGRQNQFLHAQVQLLKATLAETEAEREVWKQKEEENSVLREQMKILKHRLLEADEEMRVQLELYQAEALAFQDSIVRVEAAAAAVEGRQVPVGEMPWDFWSDLLLRIDDLMIGKHLTNEEALELRLLAWKRDLRIRDEYISVMEEGDDMAADGLRSLISQKSRPGMHIIHIAAEMAPVAKVGGLGDVVTGLGRALQQKGHLVEVILPKYDCMDYSRIKDLQLVDMELFSHFDGQLFPNKVWRGIIEGLPVYFIEPHHPARYFWRGQFYGAADDFSRFTYYCRAALEFILRAKKRPDIIHCHDWQTAAVAPLYWEIYAPRGLDSAQVAMTCHNFEYQGTAPAGSLASCGLDVAHLCVPDRMQDDFMHGRVNLLKGGIVFSNLMTTVSPTYATEVRGPEGGRGLHMVLAKHEKKFHGVLNGIDTEVWNPATDPLLEHQFSVDDTEGKQKNKHALRVRIGLSTHTNDTNKPLVGCVTRLVPQKGVHLIRHAIYHTLARGGQFVLLGSSPVPQIQAEFEGIARQLQHNPHVKLLLKYDEALSHLIYAGSDMFVIPSIFEPCGLTQLIAMRYGSIPIVRKTGGLADSVFDLDDSHLPRERRNGFIFLSADEQSLNYAMDRAFNHFYDRPKLWHSLMLNAMNTDVSWEESASQYIRLYEHTIRQRTLV